MADAMYPDGPWSVALHWPTESAIWQREDLTRATEDVESFAEIARTEGVALTATVRNRRGVLVRRVTA